MDWLSIKEFLLDTLKYIVTIILILFIVLYVVSITQVVGNSMYPTLKDGEVLILNKFIYNFKDIEREDIISLRYADTKYLIKRVIGLPGEKIEIINNKLYINDKEYQEDYLKNNLKYKDFYLKDLGYDKIPKDMYLVLGDNRENSLDSRKIGLIKKSEINGKILLRMWPLNKIKFF
ncbi:MAG: signal peptidase I [Bacilli bacterium]|nr:signal peptidase I [Bacilli bacterium]